MASKSGIRSATHALPWYKHRVWNLNLQMWYWTVMWSHWKVLSASGKTNIDFTQWACIRTSELRCQVTCSFNCSVCSIHEGLLVKKGFFHAVFLSRICDSLFDHEDWILLFQWRFNTFVSVKIQLLCFSERAVPGLVSLYCSKWGRTHPGGRPDYTNYQVKLEYRLEFFVVVFFDVMA